MNSPSTTPPNPSPWRPTGCTPDCLVGSSARRVSGARRVARALALGGGTLLLLPALAVIPRRAAGLFGRLTRGGARMICRAVGVRVRVTQDVPWPRPERGRPGLLVVSNHISWLDSLVVQVAHGPIRMLSMAEVRSWPVLGWISTRSGAIYIDRDRLSQLPDTVGEMTTALRAGEHVGAFPEGVTSCGRHRLPFRNAAFQAAVDAGARVCSLQLTYRVAGERSVHPSYVEPAGSSVWRVLGLRQVTAELAFEFVPESDSPRTRKLLAGQAQAVATALEGQ